MKDNADSRSQQLVLGMLHSRGLVSAEELQRALGKSQPTVSRLLAGLVGSVVPLGKARARRYALLQPIRGQAARQPLWWVGEDGIEQPLGTLSFLAGGWVHVESTSIHVQPAARLPWFLAPLRAQGFLGRLHAQRLATAGLAANPEQWDLASTLFAALQLHDAPGAIYLGDVLGNVRGEAAQPPQRLRLPAAGAGLAEALDRLAQDVAGTLPAGSSAGGEQPKFLAMLEGGQHVLVKFTPPRGTPFGERWHDLLWAEWLASQVLQAHGFEAATTGMVQSAHRTYLVSQRFDRVGEKGRRHVLDIGSVHQAFVAGAYTHWAATAAELQRQGRLPAAQAQQVARLLGFGRLIGNTDMHSGNLGLLATLQGLAQGRFGLAPVYDMLPMRWRPSAELGGAPDYTPFVPEANGITRPALPAALQFWQQLATLGPVSPALRTVAEEMAGRVAAL